MKIIIHSFEELLQLSALVRPTQVTNVTNMYEGLDELVEAGFSATAAGLAESLRIPRSRAEAMVRGRAPEPDGLPDDIDAPQAVVAQAAAATADLAEAIEAEGQDFPERDADGAKYSTDWHSDPKKLTAKNIWRAKRGRDEAAYKAWLSSQPADEEPVATETHALPNGYETLDPANETGLHAPPEAHAAPVQPASTVDLQALVEASQEAAMDAKDGLQDLLAGCRDFTSAHGTAEFNALKAAVAPRGDTGASLQEFTPAERRLMLACIANYPKKEA